MYLLPYVIAGVSIAILLINKARAAIILLLGQYILAFMIAIPSMPIRSIVARLVGGVLVCAILFSSKQRFTEGSVSIQVESLPRSFWFRMITALIIFIVAWGLGAQNGNITGTMSADIFMAALFNLCFGSLMLGLHQSALEAAIGLLTLLIGFDLFYGGIEPSLAIVLLMICIQLIISLATSYIMSISHSIKVNEERPQ